jgi:ADP-ribose pyrophosphatase YjhB (NUDIX family)
MVLLGIGLVCTVFVLLCKYSLKFGNNVENSVRWLVTKVTDRLPVKVIRDDRGVPFLYRYHLFTWGNDGPGLCIHHFVKSDPERGYHDHPWKRGLSFILCGGYEERILNSTGENEFTWYTVHKRNRWTFNWLNGVDNFHRVMIPENKDAWTLFAFSSRCKTWGMISLDGEYHPMSQQVSDADGGWWNTVQKGEGVHNHLEHPGKVIATVDIIVTYYCKSTCHMLSSLKPDKVIKTDNSGYKVLFIKRGKEPFKGKWALPGGRIEQKDATLVDAALRELKEETGITVNDPNKLEFVTTVGNSTRDPRGFCLTNVFHLHLDRCPKNVKAGDDAVDYQWSYISSTKTRKDIAFDHKEIISSFLAV